MFRSPVAATTMAALLAFCCAGHAARQSTTIQQNVYIDGTIVASASCKFNGGNPITVEFGDVYIEDIDSGQYRQNVGYGGLTCSGDPAGKTLQMQMSASAVQMNGIQVISTSVSGLGIELLQNNSHVNLNQWFTINASSPPVLEARVVKSTGTTLTPGQQFTASGTLLVAYN